MFYRVVVGDVCACSRLREKTAVSLYLPVSWAASTNWRVIQFVPMTAKRIIRAQFLRKGGICALYHVIMTKPVHCYAEAQMASTGEETQRGNTRKRGFERLIAGRQADTNKLLASFTKA